MNSEIKKEKNTFFNLDQNSQLLLLSILIVNVGLGGNLLATAYVLLKSSHSAIPFAETLSLSFLFGFLGQFFGASILDKINPKTIVTFINISRGIFIIIATLIFINTRSTLFIALSFLYLNMMRPMYRAVTFALIPLIADQKKLLTLNALRSGLMQVGQLSGVGMVSFLLWFAPPAFAVGINGLLCILGGVLTMFIKYTHGIMLPSASFFTTMNFIKEWHKIILALWAVPSIFFHFLIASSGPLFVALINLFIMPFNQKLGGISLGLLPLDGGFALGAILAALLFRRLKVDGDWTILIVNTALFISIIILFMMGILANNLIFASFCTFFMGVTTTTIIIHLDASLQLRLPQEIMGRAAILQDIIASVIATILLPLFGYLIDIYNVKNAIMLSSIVALAYLVVAIIVSTKTIFGRKLYTEVVKHNNF